MNTATTAQSPTRFSDAQLLHIVNLSISRYETLGLRQLTEEIVALDDQQISDETTTLITELLTAQGCGPEEPATATFLRGLMEAPGPNEDATWREERILRCVTNAIALGLHLEENGWMVRVLLEDPDDVAGPQWAELCAELDRRAAAEIGNA